MFLFSLNYVLCIATVCLTVSLYSNTSAKSLLHPLSDEFIELINKEQNSWRAGRNFPKDIPLEYLKSLMGTIITEKPKNSTSLMMKHDRETIADLPEEFDAREKWPNCPSLNDIRDQGRCGSCWAHAAVEAMTDRYCIFSNGKKNVYLSAQDLTSYESNGRGCEGSHSTWAWEHWVRFGIVTGGSYNSSEGCRPYEISPCQPHLSTFCQSLLPTPACTKTCHLGYKAHYNEDKYFGKSFYKIEKKEEHIKAEVFKNGPVQAVLTVYEDFANYKSGVYEYFRGEAIYGHAVKIIGWGVENGKKYWLAANSWNREFGMNGFFKIARGKNECGIESMVLGGEPIRMEVRLRAGHYTTAITQNLKVIDLNK